MVRQVPSWTYTRFYPQSIRPRGRLILMPTVILSGMPTTPFLIGARPFSGSGVSQYFGRDLFAACLLRARILPLTVWLINAWEAFGTHSGNANHIAIRAKSEGEPNV